MALLISSTVDVKMIFAVKQFANDLAGISIFILPIYAQEHLRKTFTWRRKFPQQMLHNELYRILCPYLKNL